MKKYILAAALVLASTSAMADRVESGSSGSYYTYTVEFSDKAAACDIAKKSALQKARTQPDEQIEGYSRCDCGQNSEQKWSCSVDVTIAKKH